MARPIFTHELVDSDFSWLLTTFKENHPHFVAVELGGLPVVMFRLSNEELQRSMVPALIEAADEDQTPDTVVPGDKVKES